MAFATSKKSPHGGMKRRGQTGWRRHGKGRFTPQLTGEELELIRKVVEKARREGTLGPGK